MKRPNGTPKLHHFAVILSGAALLLAGALAAQPGQAQSGTSAPPAEKLKASAIQVERTNPPEDLVIPESFRVATYENVIREIDKTKKFQHIYRSGDQTAANEPNLVILRMVPSAYKAGSQKKREVTTVAGATSIKVTVQFTDKSGKVLLEKELEGKVRFFGENLRATYDLAKKVAKVVDDTF